MEKGNIVWLEGKSRHGKNRIEQHGNPWTVNAKGKFNGDDAVRMRSESETFNIGQGHKMHDERWVFLKDDPNFWVRCDADAMERLCDANIPTDWLTKDV